MSAPLGDTARSPQAGVLDEHRRVSAAVRDLEVWLQEPLDPAGHWSGRLQRLLEDLAGRLRAHFGGEAEAALYTETSLRRDQAATIARLAREHGEILDAVQGAARSAAVLRGDLVRALALIRRVQSIIATLRRHEAEETEIIMRAYAQTP